MFPFFIGLISGGLIACLISQGRISVLRQALAFAEYKAEKLDQHAKHMETRVSDWRHIAKISVE